MLAKGVVLASCWRSTTANLATAAHPARVDGRVLYLCFSMLRDVLGVFWGMLGVEGVTCSIRRSSPGTHASSGVRAGISGLREPLTAWRSANAVALPAAVASVVVFALMPSSMRRSWWSGWRSLTEE